MSPSLNILITADFPPVMGGISNYHYELCKHFQKESFEILAPRLPGDKKIDASLPIRIHRRYFPGLSAHRLTAWGRWLKPLLFAAYTIPKLMRGHYTTLHCGQLIACGPTGYCWNRMTGLPYYLYLHGAEFRVHHHRMKYLKKILFRAKGLILNSQFTKQQCLKLGLPEERLLVITPATDPQRFQSGAHPTSIQTQHNLKGKKTLLTVARLDPNKGIDIALKTLPLIIKEIPNIKYIIVGTGPEEKKLKSLCQKLNLEKYVTFAGYVPDEQIPSYYAACDVFVLLTRDEHTTGLIEGFGIVYLEASAAGKPIVAGNAGGAIEAVADGISGLVVNPEDEETVTKALLQVLQNPQKAQLLGKQGQERVMRDFQWKPRAEKLMRWLHENNEK